MDLDALREALEWYDEDAGQVLPGSVPHDRIVAAARAVLDSEEAWWCETHGEAAHITDDSQSEPQWCDDIDWKKCHPVRRRLLAEEKL